MKTAQKKEKKGISRAVYPMIIMGEEQHMHWSISTKISSISDFVYMKFTSTPYISSLINFLINIIPGEAEYFLLVLISLNL